MKILISSITILLAGILILYGCSKSNKEKQKGNLTINVAPEALPMSVEGILIYDVEEGSVGLDGISEVNFGELQTSKGSLLIEVWADVLRNSGARNNDHIKATLTSATNVGNPGGEPIFTYKITKIDRLKQP